jgi:hypothetical protein
VNGRGQTGMQMCSACRGDYEDPDTSAVGESLEPEDDEEGESIGEGFLNDMGDGKAHADRREEPERAERGG